MDALGILVRSFLFIVPRIFDCSRDEMKAPRRYDPDCNEIIEAQAADARARPEPEGRMGYTAFAALLSLETDVPDRLLLTPCARSCKPHSRDPPQDFDKLLAFAVQHLCTVLQNQEGWLRAGQRFISTVLQEPIRGPTLAALTILDKKPWLSPTKPTTMFVRSDPAALILIFWKLEECKSNRAGFALI